ncbi:MAG: hypothetical protein QOH62_1989, partial [Solirubrobacteraceae bacterium]|nr:hypothetical protein [Solirubrobacteraceae bacterium]
PRPGRRRCRRRKRDQGQAEEEEASAHVLNQRINHPTVAVRPRRTCRRGQSADVYFSEVKLRSYIVLLMLRTAATSFDAAFTVLSH